MKRLLITLAALLIATVAGARQRLAIGAIVPGFSLVNAADGATVEMKPADGFIKVVVFTANECEAAKEFEPRLIEIANRYGHRGIHFYAVDSMANESLQAMKARADEQELPYPYLKDGDAHVAIAYDAGVTPHAFVIDGEGKLRYRGFIDDSARPDERKVTGLVNALNGLTAGRDVGTPVTVDSGCPIRGQ